MASVLRTKFNVLAAKVSQTRISLFQCSSFRRAKWEEKIHGKNGMMTAISIGSVLFGASAAFCDTKWGEEYDPEQHGPYFPADYNKIRIIAGSGNRQLADEVSEQLGIPVMKSSTGQYADGEVMIQLNENVRGKDIFIVQSCISPVNNSIMELLLTASAVSRASAKRVTAVIPYFGYKHHRRGFPISTGLKSRFLWSASSDFARMLEVVGVDRVIAVDLQRPGQGHEACFFSPMIPVETIITTEMAAKYLAKSIYFPRPVAIIASNSECIKQARKFELKFRKRVLQETTLAMFIPKRNTFGKEAPAKRAFELMGDVSGRDCIIVDDLIDTGASVAEMSAQLKAAGAADVYVFASHGLFSPGCIQTIRDSGIKKVIVLNTLPLPETQQWQGLVEQIHIGKWLAQLIKTEHLRSNDFEEDLEDEDYEEMNDL